MSLKRIKINTDLCVVGGGVAGMNVAITSARLGLKVTIVQERPVFGGNASGEVRMWICGTKDYYYKETGIGEEISLENYYYNPTKNYNIWNAILYGKVTNEENITSLLNCTCYDAKVKDNKIIKIIAYQMTTQTIYEIYAKNFADCSGDSILAPLTNAEFMYGREAKEVYNEPMKTHTKSDENTMGSSCLIQARKVNKKVVFHAPSWAEKISVEKLKSKGVTLNNPYENFWFIEIGGLGKTIEDAEINNKRLIAICLGIWDTVKNSGEFDADYFDLEFLGFIGAKRESRRMLGDYVLNANDMINGKVFDDVVAYGGWPLDDHYPEGLDGSESNNVIQLNNQYGIPYRCLYSKNIENLFFAGRNISLSHMAMSSARVMGTCGLIGQAVGVASYISKKYKVAPRGVLQHIDEVQQTLLKIDCFLPNIERRVSQLSKNAIINFDEKLRNGKDRDFCNETNKIIIKNGKKLEYRLEKPTTVKDIKIVFDSDLLRKSFGKMNECEKIHSMRANILDDSPNMIVPKTLAKKYILECVLENGKTLTIKKEDNNLLRNVIINLNKKVSSISLTIFSNWGETQKTGLFTFEIN